MIQSIERAAAILGLFRENRYLSIAQISEMTGLAKTTAHGIVSTLKETGNHLVRALDANPGIRCILRGIDGWSLFDDKDHMRTDAVYPDYLYDDNLINDVEYVFNKDILFNYTLETVKHTLKGLPTTDFDTYSSWDTSETGRDRLLSVYQRPDASPAAALCAEDLEDMKENIEQNILSSVRAHPDVQFYLFFSPYSIYYMDEQNQRGILRQQFECFLAATEMLLEYENVHLFCFFDDYSLITGPDNYTDVTHYTAQVNSLLLQRIAAGEYQLTKENYVRRWKEITDFYTAYDFESLFP